MPQIQEKEKKENIIADAETYKAQLRKTQPSITIIKESLRNIAEILKTLGTISGATQLIQKIMQILAG